MAERYQLISADSHVSEPGDLWTSRVARAHRDRVPRIERRDDEWVWVMDEVTLPVEAGSGDRSASVRASAHGMANAVDEEPSIAADPSIRLEQQDADGVDAEVLFPGVPFQPIVATRDADLHHAMVAAYNDWLSEYCSFSPRRLGGVAMLPNRGVAAAVHEFERVRSMPGIMAVQIGAYPHGDTSIAAEDDELWAAIDDSGMAICIHVGLDDEMPCTGRRAPYPGMVQFHDAPGRMLELIFSGVLDRFPELQFVLAEVGCGWLPYFAEQADDNYMRHAKATLRNQQLPRLPSYYMRDRFSATFVSDPYGLVNRERIGVHRMMWSSHFPRSTSDWPDSWKSISMTMAGFSRTERHAVLAGNAERIFGFTH